MSWKIELTNQQGGFGHNQLRRRHYHVTLMHKEDKRRTSFSQCKIKKKEKCLVLIYVWHLAYR